MFFLLVNLLMSCVGTPDRVLCDESSHSGEIRPLLERVCTTSFNVLNLYDNLLFFCWAIFSFFLNTVFCCDKMLFFRLSKLTGDAWNVLLLSRVRPTSGCGGVLVMALVFGSLHPLGAFLSFVS